MAAEPGGLFDELLPQLNADRLRRVVSAWGLAGKAKNKAAMLNACLDLLKHPDQIRAMLARLGTYEQAALSVLRQWHGTVPLTLLAVELSSRGIHPPPQPAGRHSIRASAAYAFPLIDCGLVFLSQGPEGEYYLLYGFGAEQLLLSDTRLLDHAAPLAPPPPMVIDPVPPPQVGRVRRPVDVISDHLAVVLGVQRMEGLPVNRNGELSLPGLRKLAKQLGWTAGREPDVDRVTGVVLDLQARGLLFYDPGGRMQVVSDAFQRLSAGLAVQATSLLTTFTRMHVPVSPQYGEGIPLTNDDALGRILIVQALQSLPLAPGSWCALKDLDEAIFQRYGEIWGRNGAVRSVGAGKDDAAEHKRWRDRVQALWRQNTSPWICNELMEDLHRLGLVHLGGPPGEPAEAFGFASLWYALRGGVVEPDGASAWIVQPNFEVVVYLDRVTPAQLVLLARAAESRAVTEHTMTYQITRDSLYRMLEGGLTLAQLEQGLYAGAARPVPQNVLVTLAEWATRRERLRIIRGARLLEFETAAERDRTAARIGGEPVGGRLLLVQGRPDVRVAARRDYAGPPTRCLILAEDGTITLDARHADLLAASELDRIAEHDPQHTNTWRITARSVQAAGAQGLTAAQIVRVLSDRSAKPPHPLALAAVRSWGGVAPGVQLGGVLVLRITDPQLLEAVVKSARLRPHLLGLYAPDLIAVRPEAAEELRAALAALGITPAGLAGPAALPDP